MFAFLGGVPKAVVPDNLKSAVIKADRFDPGLNRTYAEMAAHYGTVGSSREAIVGLGNSSSSKLSSDNSGSSGQDKPAWRARIR